MSSLAKVTVIIPSLNPDEKLKKTVQGLINVGFTDIVLINDGSKAECEQNFPSPEEYPCCTVINHWINRGKGAGLKTAFAYVRKTRPEALGVVAVDGDGQHRPEDVLACAMRMLEENKIVLGARNFNLPGIPARSVFGNKMTSFVFKYLCGIKITDTQTGLRAIPIEYLDTLMAVKGDRFEYETNMLLAFKDNDIPFTENSIETVYIEENKTSHFNPLRDSFMIYKQIFGYAFSSLSATAIDLALFTLFSFLFLSGFSETKESVFICTACCTVAARIISSLYNYFVNSRLVFAKQTGAKHTMLKYYVLVILIMLISGASVGGITILLPNGTKEIIITLIKAAVDTVLFILSFTLQREWVFGGKKKK